MMKSSIRRQKNWSEEIIWDILNKSGEGWNFFEVINENGGSEEQVKIYDYPYRIAYPDFEKRNNGKLVLLVETKGYFGYFCNRSNALAMKKKHFKQYIVVQRKEKSEIRVAFVIKNKNETLFFWETLDNMKNMEYYIDVYDGLEYVFWDAREFRTDIEKLGL